ncbi:type VI secretion system protein TssA [Pseudomonas cichorii]|uniref:Type VI secretion system protein TssA n=1 Tax=Pseudomonas lijiangensis TaxID=2995658 RepID=A0ABX8HYK3_9PSED|nr:MULTISPECIES: type VI secretion system protein TssA [Pseudomonas syringae group]MBX8488850.1 type VI secretion system protein TssA [Pseudomonas cichorii]MBX8501582.1 type VI secretion system protein TssA [Pseudomonas lijiangensis]MBX8506456.1 type VI secretion system protein TssA [Pseudomonas lijiangensis]MBX8518599.1 type VI secretion system protein TssA [Pseudomonas cichorii]MBX8536599.1 type VI secretion system protein TssA [Pseudomonas cichorii]
MTYSDTLSSRYLELVERPVSEQCPEGDDVRFSTEFEALEGELSKVYSLQGSVQVDWLKVRELSEHILRENSKDLRVAVWLVWALYQCESFPGLLAGINLLHHLCSHRWQVLHPRKSRTRTAALNWLVPRLEQVLVEGVSVTTQLPLFQNLVETLEALDNLLTNYLGDEAPLILPVRRRLAVMVQRAVESKADTETLIVQVKQVAARVFKSDVHIESEKDAHKALKAQQESAQKLCAWWLRQKATDVRALRLSRTVFWLSIDKVPECNVRQVTALHGLSAEKLNGYAERFKQGRYADLIVDIEASLALTPFWFDGQRLLWECLRALKAESAMREVEILFALFLERLPGICDLKFQDGSPFADDDTHRWINEQVMPHLHVDTVDDTPDERVVQPEWDVVLEEALSVLRSDGLKSAVQMLKQKLQSSQGQRERFHWQFALAKICYSAKKYELAKSQLEVLDQYLQDSGLHTWEPELSLKVMHTLNSCYECLPQSNVVRERKDEIYRRLCHLDLEVLLE